jgi:hypothetical protein
MFVGSPITFKKKLKLLFYIFKLFWFINVKNKFFKKYYFDIFLGKKYFK